MRYTRLACPLPLLVLAACVAQPGDNVPPDMVKAITSLPAAEPDAAAARALQAPPPPVPATPAAAPAAAAVLAGAPDLTGAEKLLVRAPLNFAGFWRLYSPHRISIGFGLPTRITYSDVGPEICRVLQHGDALTGSCVSDTAAILNGSTSPESVQFELRGDGPTVRVDAALSGAHALRGRLSVRLLAVVPLPSLPITGVKLDSKRYPPASPADAARLRAALDALVKTQPDLAALGELTKITPIETVPVFGRKIVGRQQVDVFTADFDRGSRLCGLPRSAGGALVCG